MRHFHLQRYLITGLLTIIPLWVTVAVFGFVLRLLAGIGAPLVEGALRALHGVAPDAVASLEQGWVNNALALVATLLLLYVVGWLANRVLGRRLLAGFDAVMDRIPMVRTIYDGTKKLTAMMQKKPSGTQRVVLVEFPHPGMRTIGFVTSTLREQQTGREMVAVFVPTTPNPTGGYLEIVPLDHVTPTDWTVDQAMAFIISGGAAAPDNLPPSVPCTMRMAGTVAVAPDR
ncbi:MULTISPECIES: DUF502 domain-containing protein [Metallibacterium]|jgi:uncharacterized membrane protein|uniref:DUF502 domain-containing protein n=1 Tax=Metallibacterium TaxID=1218803 RepID=UPI002607F188|nr:MULTISPECIES: DUF502 domain-containing protein [Metallibacterium]MBW8075588.1 DUF502 domain-containing protein [Metallibacterium scheffleri]